MSSSLNQGPASTSSSSSSAKSLLRSRCLIPEDRDGRRRLERGLGMAMPAECARGGPPPALLPPSPPSLLYSKEGCSDIVPSEPLHHQTFNLMSPGHLLHFSRASSSSGFGNEEAVRITEENGRTQHPGSSEERVHGDSARGRVHCPVRLQKQESKDM